MKRDEKETAKRMQIFAVCGCLCLLAVGAGVTYRTVEGRKLPQQGMEQSQQLQPVTAAKTPTLDMAKLEREKKSQDPGENPDQSGQKQQKREEEPSPSKETAEPVFAYPLQGEVVLPYSMEHAIYDPTLEQYRTNAGISLSAEQGSAVTAAADGRVKEIKEDEETGKTVTIEHSNGWLTTYGQLEEDVKVKEGERVKQGQAIGFVDAPTKYGTALGSHLTFEMEKDGAAVNPEEKLEKK